MKKRHEAQKGWHEDERGGECRQGRRGEAEHGEAGQREKRRTDDKEAKNK